MVPPLQNNLKTPVIILPQVNSFNAPTLTIQNAGSPVFSRSFAPNNDTLDPFEILTSMLGRFEIGPLPLQPLGQVVGNNQLSDPLLALLSDHGSDVNDAPYQPTRAGFASTFAFPTEAQLFARDPEELGEFFDALPTDSATIRAQLFDFQYPLSNWSQPQDSGNPQLLDVVGATALLPNTLSLLAPPTARKNIISIGGGGGKGGGPINPVVDSYTMQWPLNYNELFGNPDAPLGNVSAAGAAGEPYTSTTLGPFGQSSVKAVKVQRAGGCTREQFFEDLFSSGSSIDIVGTIQDHLSSNCSGGVELVVHTVTIVPLIRHNTANINDARAQLFINGNVTIYVDTGDVWCNLAFSALLEFYIDEAGGLAVDFTKINGRDAYTVVGGCAAGIGDYVPDLFLGAVTTYTAVFEIDGTGTLVWTGPFANILQGDVQSVFSSLQDLPGPINDQIRQSQSILADSVFTALGSTDPDFVVPTTYDELLHQILGVSISSDFDSFFSTVGNPVGDAWYSPVFRSASFPFADCTSARNDLCGLVRYGFTVAGWRPSGNGKSELNLSDVVPSDPTPRYRMEPSQPYLPPNLWLSTPGLCTLLNADGTSGITGNSVNDDERLLQSMLRAMESLTDDGSLKYWSCRTTDRSLLGRRDCRCLFRPPVQRLIPNPDSLQAVFYDPILAESPTDPNVAAQNWNNASLGLTYALKGINYLITNYGGASIANELKADGVPVDADGNPDVLGYLCNYVPGQRQSASEPSTRLFQKQNTKEVAVQNMPFTRPFNFLMIDRIHCPMRIGPPGAFTCEYEVDAKTQFVRQIKSCTNQTFYTLGEEFYPYCPGSLYAPQLFTNISNLTSTGLDVLVKVSPASDGWYYTLDCLA